METITNFIQTAKNVAAWTIIAFVGGIFSALIIDTSGTVHMLHSWIAINDYFIVKVLAGFCGAFLLKRHHKAWRKWVLRKVVHFIEDLTELFWPVHREAGELEGIPHSELLDHLFTARSFKRQDIEDKFLIPRYKVTELKAELERVGVLVRGENNAHILNPEYSRQDVASIIQPVQRAKDLQPLFRKKGNGFTTQPSAKEIEKRVALPSPTSLVSAADLGFTKRLISA